MPDTAQHQGSRCHVRPVLQASPRWGQTRFTAGGLACPRPHGLGGPSPGTKPAPRPEPGVPLLPFPASTLEERGNLWIVGDSWRRAASHCPPCTPFSRQGLSPWSLHTLLAHGCPAPCSQAHCHAASSHQERLVLSSFVLGCARLIHIHPLPPGDALVTIKGSEHLELRDRGVQIPAVQQRVFSGDTPLEYCRREVPEAGRRSAGCAVSRGVSDHAVPGRECRPGRAGRS